MKKILLATTLLSMAVSENILMEDHPRLKTAWMCDKQLWNKRTKRIPRKDIPLEIEESLNYDDARQFPRISDTRFISESRKLPSMAVIRRHDLTRFAQVDLSSDKSKLDGAKPRVLISIGIQEKNADNNLQEDCSTRKSYCKHNQGWQMQQPFYVDEPRSIDIDVDYIDSSQRLDNGDPYILTRGKKIYRIDDPEQADKTVEDYEATLDYLSKNKKLLIKNRVRRSARTNGGSQDETADERNDRMKERDHYDSLQDTDRDTNNTAIIKIENGGEKSFEIDKISEDEKAKAANYDVFNKIYEKVDPKNLANRSSRRYKFTKQNQISGNGDIITDFVEQRQKIQREDIPNNTENGSGKTAKIDQIERLDDSKSYFTINTNRKSVLLKNHHLPEIRKKREIGSVYSKKDVEKNETETYEQKNKVYINELNDLGTPDNLFTLSQDKDSINSESLNKKDLDGNKFIERTWELHYAHRKKLKNEGAAKNEEDGSEINNDNVGIANSQLTNAINFNSKNFEAKAKTNYRLRERRNVCKACRMKSQFQRNEWLKDIGRKIQDSLSLERRDKHSGPDIWTLSPEPYFISRGKKDFGRDDLPSMPRSRNTNDGERAKALSFPVADGLLRTLLTEMSKCNDENCGMNANRLSNERLSPRDRRDPRPGMLEEIFAKYDPYYVARGKRMSRNQRGVSLETDAMQ